MMMMLMGDDDSDDNDDNSNNNNNNKAKLSRNNYCHLLRAMHTLFHSILMQCYEEVTTLISVLSMWRLRLRKVEQLVQNHAAHKWWK